MDIGKVIKEARKSKGLKQQSCAEMCGITQTYLSQIENNVKEPTISLLKRIAEKLHLPLPILYFLSLEKDDIEERKRDAYELLMPSIKSLVNQFFSDNLKDK